MNSNLSGHEHSFLGTQPNPFTKALPVTVFGAKMLKGGDRECRGYKVRNTSWPVSGNSCQLLQEKRNLHDSNTEHRL